MDFYENIENIILKDDEVEQFEAGPNGYYAYLASGGRIDIQRVFSFQPHIENFDDFYSFMFAESPRGFFVFRQRVIDNRVAPWRVFLELRARAPHVFFASAWQLACKLRENRNSLPDRLSNPID